MTLEFEKHDRFSEASVIGISDDGCEPHIREALFYWNCTVGCQVFGELPKTCFRASGMKGKRLGVMKKVENNLHS